MKAVDINISAGLVQTAVRGAGFLEKIVETGVPTKSQTLLVEDES